MKTIYVVEGSTGEYSDWTTWIVCAYENEQTARQHVERAEAEVRERKEHLRGIGDGLGHADYHRKRDAWIKANPPRWDTVRDQDDDWSEEINYTATAVPVRVRLPRGKS